MIERVIGYVDGQPVFYEETEPTTYETNPDIGPKASHDIEITATDDHDNSTTLRTVAYGEGWIEPITDRNETDLRLKTERAYLNYFDLNRIEQDTEYLAVVLNGYGYGQLRDYFKAWQMTDFPYSAEMERIRLNIQKIIEGYYTQEVDLPVSLEGLDWVKLNAVEMNLKLIKEMIGRMEQSFRYSGTFFSGQAVVF